MPTSTVTKHIGSVQARRSRVDTGVYDLWEHSDDLNHPVREQVVHALVGTLFVSADNAEGNVINERLFKSQAKVIPQDSEEM